MTSWKLRRPVGLAIAALFALPIGALIARPAAAASTTFTLNSSQSSIALTANLNVLGGALVASQQKAGSLTSKYTGSVVVGLDNGPNINYVGGSAANATALSGISPAVGGAGGTAPADYGVTLVAPIDPPIALPPLDLALFGLSGTLNLGTLTSVNTDVALRDIILDVTSPGDLPLSGGAFDASQLSLTLTSGSADINLAAVLTAPDLFTKALTFLGLQTLASSLSGTFPISVTTPSLFSLNIEISTGFNVPLTGTVIPNLGAGSGLLEVSGGQYKLTTPVNFNVLDSLGLDGLVDATFAMNGNLVGFAPLPEPSGIAMACVAFAAIVGVALRRRRT